MRFVHTNIISKDYRKLSLFYQTVFGCKPVPPPRDLRGEWLNKLTGICNAHITGEHLALPGYSDTLPTLEILSYDEILQAEDRCINRMGFAHIAFEVEDVEATLEAMLKAGGGQVGEIVHAQYPNNVTATFVYATDPEGNIVELQSWHRAD